MSPNPCFDPYLRTTSYFIKEKEKVLTSEKGRWRSPCYLSHVQICCYHTHTVEANPPPEGYQGLGNKEPHPLLLSNHIFS